LARILDGKGIAAQVKEEIKREINLWKEKGINPSLAVVLVGDDPASVYYAQAKKRVCDSLGLDYRLTNLPPSAGEAEVLKIIEDLNKDKAIHGIMVELPLPGHINTKKITAAIDPLKDSDGVNPVNRGYIMTGDEGLYPATPQSCIEILLRSGVEIAGKHVVIVGRGETVGKPLVFMILRHNATVSVCHSKTPDLAHFTGQGDIVIVAVGKPRIIKAEMIKEGAVVVDAGINETEEGMCGDVDYDNVRNKAGMVSPVPGGVGSLTTALLLKNVLKGIVLQRKL